MPKPFIRSPIQTGWAMVMVVVACLLTGSFAVGYSIHLQRQWCSLLNAIDPPDGPAPTTQRGVVVQTEIRSLRSNLGCAQPHEVLD